MNKEVILASDNMLKIEASELFTLPQDAGMHLCEPVLVERGALRADRIYFHDHECRARH